MKAKWLAYNKATQVNEYIEVPILADGIKLNINMTQFAVSNIAVVYNAFLNYELPFAWQEILLVDDLGATKYIFYFKSLTAPMFATGQETIRLKLSLYSTRELLSHRTVTLIENNNINALVENLVADILTSDGYTIVDNDLSTTNIVQISYIKQSIETILNDLANTYEFVWYSDEFKHIYFKSISNLTNGTTDILINDDKLNDNYGVNIQPILSTTDYNNVVELTNVLLVGLAPNGILSNETINPYIYVEENETNNFKRNVWLTDEAVYKNHATTVSNVTVMRFLFNISGSSVEYDIEWNRVGGFIYPSEIGFDGVDNNDVSKLILLIRDQDNNDLITGCKCINLTTTHYISASSVIALNPTTYTYYDNQQILKIQPYTNTSGKIQKSINMYNRYFGKDELLATAQGLLTKSNSIAGEVKLLFEVNDKSGDLPHIALGNVIEINRTDNVGQLIGRQKYVISDYTRNENHIRYTYTVTAKNINLNQTYIDLYRKIKFQDNKEQLTNNIAIYVKDDQVIESTQVTVDGVDIYES